MLLWNEHTYRMVTGDLNRDGRPDLVLTHTDHKSINNIDVVLNATK